jgi:hypothetical protein
MRDVGQFTGFGAVEQRTRLTGIRQVDPERAPGGIGRLDPVADREATRCAHPAAGRRDRGLRGHQVVHRVAAEQRAALARRKADLLNGIGDRPASVARPAQHMRVEGRRPLGIRRHSST